MYIYIYNYIHDNIYIYISFHFIGFSDEEFLALAACARTGRPAFFSPRDHAHLGQTSGQSSARGLRRSERSKTKDKLDFGIPHPKKYKNYENMKTRNLKFSENLCSYIVFDDLGAREYWHPIL